MSLHTELGLFGLPDYKDVAPTVLPERLSGFEPLHLRQTSGMLPRHPTNAGFR
jgi:hypothetical protein